MVQRIWSLTCENCLFLLNMHAVGPRFTDALQAALLSWEHAACNGGDRNNAINGCDSSDSNGGDSKRGTPHPVTSNCH